MSRKDVYFLLLGAILVLAIAAIVAVVARLPLVTELTQVAMLFAGMLGVAALSSISRFIDGATGSAFIHISFNEPRVREVLEAGAPPHAHGRRESEEGAAPWEPTS